MPSSNWTIKKTKATKPIIGIIWLSSKFKFIAIDRISPKLTAIIGPT